jgi:hypothetical protein
VPAEEVDRGEPGWDLGLQYTTLEDLIDQLRSHHVYVGTVQRLVINCHGNPGLLRLEPLGRVAAGQDHDGGGNNDQPQLGSALAGSCQPGTVKLTVWLVMT